MDQAALLSILGSFYDKLVNDVSERVIDKLVRDGALTTEIDSQIKAHLDDFSDHMAMMDRSAIEEIVTAHLEDREVVTRQDLSDYVQEDDFYDSIRDVIRSQVTVSIDIA